MNKKIILASASPRRRELLTQIGLDFDVVVSETEDQLHRAGGSGGRTVSAEGGSGVGEACGKWCL